jgi:hypothetical protein
MGAVMATRAAYVRRLEAQIKVWDATIGVWSAKADKATASARLHYESELDSLRSKRAVAQNTLENLAKRSDDAWEDLMEGAERTWREMNKAMKKGAARFT